MGSQQFGSFAQLFTEEVLYLHLLNLGDATKAITTIQKVIQESNDLEKEIQNLLENINWRPHLVAGVALLMIDSMNLSADVWKAFDRGSWVNPQLAVIAFFHDPDFSQRARERLEKRCPIGLELSRPISMLEVHVARGPGGNHQLSCKSMASLMALCPLIPSLAGYVSELSGLEDVQRMIAEDWDKAGRIAQGWLRGITAYFDELGIELIRSENQQRFNKGVINKLLNLGEH